jgi:hypothetical protein
MRKLVLLHARAPGSHVQELVMAVPKEQLLTEIEDVLRVAPTLQEYAAASGSDEHIAWLGRAAAAIENGTGNSSRPPPQPLPVRRVDAVRVDVQCRRNTRVPELPRRCGPIEL